MPLTLIGKKSWNPHLDKNVSRVKADEDAYTARDEQLQHLRDEHEGSVRLAQLRGEDAPELPSEIQQLEELQQDALNGRLRSEGDAHRQHEDLRKRRKLHGEDDTDRDIRVARSTVNGAYDGAARRGSRRDDAALVGKDGHLQLFAADEERDRRNSRKEDGDSRRGEPERSGVGNEGGMRFTDAAGYNKHSGDDPWYTGGNGGDEAKARTNVFGREDPGRQRRAQARAAVTDPFSMMQAAQRQIKQSVSDAGDDARREERPPRATRDDRDHHRRSHHRHSRRSPSPEHHSSRRHHSDRSHRKHRSRSRSPRHRNG